MSGPARAGGRAAGGIGGRPGRALALALMLVAGVGMAARAAEPVLGVAPFERAGADGKGIPDVASRLAERLGASGLSRVVGPERLSVPPGTRPDPAALVGPAAEAGVSVVVVGRTTRIGDRLSVDARVLEAASGAPIGSPIVQEVAGPGELGGALDGLASRVLARLEGLDRGDVAAAPPPRAPRPAAAGPDETGPGTEDEGSGAGFDAGAPIAIKADELEVESQGQQRKFVFRGNVEAVQGELTVRSARLEAFYPAGGSQPERLVATGEVMLEQAERVVTCEVATFYRSDQRVECEGQARLDQACDRVRGDKITFYLDKEVMHVVGAADVQMRPDEPGCGTARAEAPAEAER